jgi:hypothetical protein
MSDPAFELSLEQKFNIRSFETQIANLNRDEALSLLIELYEQMILRESMYKHFLRHEWGLDAKPDFS